jgi:hypothetical protein
VTDADLRDHRAAVLRDPDTHALHEHAKAHLDAVNAIRERYGALSTTIAYLIRSGWLVPSHTLPDPPPEGVDPAFGRQWLRAEGYLAAIRRAKALLDDPDATVDRETVRAALTIPVTDEDRAEWAQSGLDVLSTRALRTLAAGEER